MGIGGPQPPTCRVVRCAGAPVMLVFTNTQDVDPDLTVA